MKNFFTRKRRCLSLPQFDLKMKLTTLFLLVAIFALQANSSYSQKTKISLDFENVPVTEVIDDIESKTKFRFVYKMKDVDIDRKVSIKVKKAGIERILELLFAQTDTEYKVLDLQIVLREATVPKTVPQQQATTVQDPITVTGQVTNADGVPLPGVTVVVKGTTRGVATDFEGNYQIVVPNSQSILVFSSIGYEEQEITVGNQTTINVIMEKSVSQLDEVVVSTGYYEVQQKLNPGNIGVVDAEIIEQQPIANPLQAIQGRIAGVNVIQETGLPGGGFNIEIRGRNSLNTGLAGANQPLYIIDGVPFTNSSIAGQLGGVLQNEVNPLSSINPNDIKTIQVLKDADATAIYGSRGSNGVVLIETKRGETGKVSLNIDHLSGLSQVGNFLDLLGTEEYLEMRREAYRNDSREIRGGAARDLLEWDTSRETDWQKELIGGTAVTNRTGISISGGSERTNFLLGATYYGEGTVFPGDFKYERLSGNFKLDHTSKDNKLNVSFSTIYSADNNELPQSDLTSEIDLPPNAPALFNENGDINWENNTFINPLAALNDRIYEGRTNTLVTNATFNYNLFGGLSFNANVGFSEMQLREFGAEPLSIRRPDIRNRFVSAARSSNNKVSTWIAEPQFVYDQKIGKGTLSALLGFTFQESNTEGDLIDGVDFPSDALLRNLQAANILNVFPQFNQYRYTAIFGRLNYNYADRYVFNLTGRRDGSSRFGPGNRFGNFGAVAGAWIFSNEAFLKDSKVLNFGKLRASYGSTGSDNIGDYGYLNTYQISRRNYVGSVGLVPSRLPNEGYSWETTTKLEFGLELGLFGDRLGINASWYRNRTTDQLLGLPLPQMTGSQRIDFNLPATVENRGWEILVNTTNVATSSFSWKSNFNLSVPRNELIEYADLDESPFFTRFEIGKSLYIQRRYTYLGVDPETGEYSFKDLNGDGLISLDDQELTTDLAPDFFGGVSNTFRLGGITLDVFLQFVKQNGLAFINGFSQQPGARANQLSEVTRRWQNPGDVSDIQRYSVSRARNAYALLRQSDAAIVDASFIRLKNVALSYDIPVDRIAGIKACSVLLQGQNLLTFTNYVGLDPESQSLRLPPLRIINLGLNLSF